MVRRLESVFDIRFKEWIIEGRGRVSLMNKWRENPGGFVLISVGRKQGNKTLLRSPLVRCRCSKVRIVSRLSSISVTLLIEFLSFPPPPPPPQKKYSSRVENYPRQFELTKNRETRSRGHNYTQLYRENRIWRDVNGAGRSFVQSAKMNREEERKQRSSLDGFLFARLERRWTIKA